MKPSPVVQPVPERLRQILEECAAYGKDIAAAGDGQGQAVVLAAREGLALLPPASPGGDTEVYPPVKCRKCGAEWAGSGVLNECPECPPASPGGEEREARREAIEVPGHPNPFRGRGGERPTWAEACAWLRTEYAREKTDETWHHYAYALADELFRAMPTALAAPSVGEAREITDEGIERAAKAIYDANLAHPSLPWERLIQTTQEDCRRLARAALSAARETRGDADV